MVVITVTDCPAKLRGDLSKWLLEISTGVYVGNLDARTRENLWERVKTSIKSGRATLTYSCRGEQGLQFDTVGDTWRTVDFDGLLLVERPSSASVMENDKLPLEANFSKAAKFEIAKNRQKKSTAKAVGKNFVVLDLETTSLDPKEGYILEIGAIKCEDGQEISTFNVLIKQQEKLPKTITELTGISDELIAGEGIERKEALLQLLEFIDGYDLVLHNAKFDLAFLKKELADQGLKLPKCHYEDTMLLAKKLRIKSKSFSLQDLADYFGNTEKQAHRALSDCQMTLQVYGELYKKS